MAVYPKLNKKLGLIGTTCLIVWGVFILGMQLFVFGYYSKVFGEGTGDSSWGNAYCGMALANSAACLFFGIFYIIVFTEKTTNQRLLWGIILAVVGACAAAASTVLSALQSDWLNTAVNADSIHPCIAPSELETDPYIPTAHICSTWLALEITVSVLSALAFSEYIFIGCIIFIGLSAGKSSDNHHLNPTPYLHPMASSKEAPQQPNMLRVNNNNMTQQTKGTDGPYSAYNHSPPSQPKSPGPASSQHSYDDFNPQFSYHLQQLSLQQMAQQSVKPPSPKNSPVMQQTNARPPHREAPAAPSSQMNRGRLQVLHYQRQRAPAAPAVPSKPPTNNSNLYRY